MEQVKLPQMKVKIRTLSDSPSNEETQWIQVNPSCLLAYLGIRGYANTPKSGEATVNKNALPILTYFDIFKNYYANTQEESFYMIGGSPVIKAQINGKNIPNNDDMRESTRRNNIIKRNTTEPKNIDKRGNQIQNKNKRTSKRTNPNRRQFRRLGRNRKRHQNRDNGSYEY